MFLTVCLNPTLQKTLIVEKLVSDAINRSRQFYFDISGKGINVSRVLTQLGEKVIHCTHLGGCFTDFFLIQAERERIPVEYVSSDSEIRFAMTVIDSTNHTATELLEEGIPVSRTTEDKIRNLFLTLIGRSHTVILSGTTAPGYSASIFAWMTEQAKEQNKTVICDFRGADLHTALHFAPDVIKPNLFEFIHTFLPEYRERESEASEAVREMMAELFRSFSSKIIITDGSGPIRYIDENGYAEMMPQQLTPANTIGCGDAFTAGFASAYHRNSDFLKAIRKGEECARLNALSIRPGSIV
ncbi:MAG: tagatose-6-phosphate kinase [Spirochaetales bacterium]|nr:tagatose-6-phosphate kinase [Spirochaetales bacterium]